MSKRDDGWTEYSDEVPGDRGNYGQRVRFDQANGYVGISQKDGVRWTDRVLLTPAQVQELMKFLRRKRAQP